MFETVWKPVISAVAYAFTSFEDDHIIERSIAGFRQCATLAGHFVLPDVFDYVVVSLSQATSLLSEQLPRRVPNYPVVTVENQPVTVSTLSVKFGTNFRGQLAAVVLFNIVNGNGNALREGWTQVRWSLCLQVSEAHWQIDIRNVHEPVPTHLAPLEYAADGGFLEWSLGYSPARQCPVPTSAQNRRALICAFIILNDSIRFE